MQKKRERRREGLSASFAVPRSLCLWQVRCTLQALENFPINSNFIFWKIIICSQTHMTGSHIQYILQYIFLLKYLIEAMWCLHSVDTIVYMFSIPVNRHILNLQGIIFYLFSPQFILTYLLSLETSGTSLKFKIKGWVVGLEIDWLVGSTAADISAFESILCQFRCYW